MKGEGKIKEKYYEIITITSNNFRNFTTPINKGKNNKKNDNYEYYKSHHHQVLSQ